jgi:hypothetical protein
VATSPRFEETGGGAAFGNPNLVRQGARAGVTQTPSAANPAPGGYTPAPSNATAAPKGSTKEIFTGLAEALNTYQQRLVKQGKYEVADIYEIEFTPGMGAASMQRPGETDKKKVPMQDAKTAKDKLNPATNSVNAKGRSMEVNAGMQIVQFIDQVMRNSTYITDQQLADIDAEGKATPNGKPTTGQTAWYKISVQATQLGYDKKRHDHAYRMKFVISPYAINTMQSEFFPNSRFRGAHKRYNYWFTGQNAEILNFEQDFNNLYRLIISGIASGIQKQARTDFRDQYRRTALATSEQSNQGADNYVGEPAANAADFLYSPTDQAKVRLRIVGDPAWMQQGEIATGVNSRTFNFEPFNTDGTINYDSQEVVFDVSFNRPADYNFDTGLMDVTAKNTKNNEPQENATYTAIKCKNIFSKGRFEQELEGRLLIEFDTKTGSTTAPTPARPATSATPAQDTRTPLQAKGEALFKDYTTNTLKLPDTLASPTPNNSLLSPAVAQEFTNLPASNPAPPTSNGDIVTTSPTTFAQSTAQGQQRQNNRLIEALAGQVKNNQLSAKDQ